MTAFSFWVQKAKVFMINEKSPTPNKIIKKAQKSNPKKRKAPPDPDGYFRELASRGRKAITRYQKLNPGADRHELVWFLLLDLMHLCDRDPTLGSFEDACIYADGIYDDLVRESKSLVSEL